MSCRRMTHNTFKKAMAMFLAISIGFPILPKDQAFAMATATGDSDGDGSKPSEGSKADAGASSKSYQPNLFTGSLGQSIPIAVPSGKDGMVPSLALHYSSDNPMKSWVGAHFSLGIGEISRKGSGGGIPFFNLGDTFTLSISGIQTDLEFDAQRNQYITRDEQFLKIEQFNGTNDSHWIVHTPDGSKHHFGTTDDSRIYRVGFASGDSNVRTWALSKSCNANGYCMEVDYDTTGVAIDGDFYLKTIRYTKHEETGLDVGRAIDFILEARDPGSVMAQFNTGSRVRMSKRLKEIKVWAGPGKINLFVSYRLFYGKSSSIWDSSESRLVRVDQFGTAGTIMARSLFEYTERAPGFLLAAGEALPISSFVTPSPLNTCIPSHYVPNTWDVGYRFLDFNGDGRMDLMRSLWLGGNAYSQGLWVRTVNGWNSVDLGTRPSVTVAYQTGLSPRGIFLTWPDIESICGNGLIHLPATYGPQDSNHLLLDVDADGFTDMLGPWDASIGLWRNEDGARWRELMDSGNPVETANMGLTELFGKHEPVNLDGDACPDFLETFSSPQNSDFADRRVTLRACGSPIAQTRLSAVGTIGDFPRDDKRQNEGFIFSDFNGDGLDDRILFNGRYVKNGVEQEPSVWDVKLNTGSSWSSFSGQPPPLQRVTNSYTGVVSHQSEQREQLLGRLADLNNDGFLDVVRGQDVFIHQQEGGYLQLVNALPVPVDRIDKDRNGTVSNAENEMGWQDNGIRIVDFNSDGLQDIVLANGVEPSRVYLAAEATSSNPAPAPGLLKKVTTGNGSVAEFSFSPSVRFSNTRLPFNKPVLTSVRVHDGRGNSYQTTYAYEGGLFDGPSRDFRGFRKVTVTDPVGNISETFFHQEAAIVGQVEKEIVMDNARRKFVETRTFYTGDFQAPDCSAGNYDCTKPYFNPARRSEVEQCEGGTNCRTIATESDVALNFDGFLEQSVTRNLGRPGETEGPPDKRTTSVSTLVSNKKKWILHLPAETKLFAGIGTGDSPIRESRIFYDTGDGYYSGGSHLLQPESPRPVRTETSANFGGFPDTTIPRVVETRYDNIYKHVVGVKNVRGHWSTIDYDAGHIYPIRATNSLGHFSRTSYDAYGRVEWTEDANHIRSVNTYDHFHRSVRTHVEVAGIKESESLAEFHNFCDEMCQSDPPSCETDVTTCKTAQPNSATLPPRVRAVSSLESADCAGYEATGNKCNWSESYPDGLGRGYKSISKGVDANGNADNAYNTVVETEFDFAGRPKRTSIPRYVGSPLPAEYLWTVNDYDTIGRVIRVTFPSNSALEDDLITTRTEYDVGRRTVYDAKGNRKIYESNGIGQLVRVKEYLRDGQNIEREHILEYGYDILGNLDRLSDHFDPADFDNTVQTTIGYDGFGQKRRMDDPDMGVWEYEYDLAGSLYRQTDSKLNRTTLYYDPLGRLDSKSAIDQEDGVAHDYFFRYDRDWSGTTRGASTGKLVQEWAEDGNEMGNYVLDLTYDSLGRVVTKRTAISGKEIGYDYSDYAPGGAILSVTVDATDPNPEFIRYRYDHLGRLKSMESDEMGLVGTAKYIADVNYDFAGRMVRLVTGDMSERGGSPGHEALYTYNTLGDQKLESMKVKSVTAGAGGPFLVNFAYAFDKNGNLLNLSDWSVAFGVPQVVDRQYQYDDLDRLKVAILTDNTNPQNTVVEERDYAYDLMGNVLELTPKINGTIDGEAYRPFGKPYAQGPQDPTAIAPSPMPTVTPIPHLTPVATITPIPLPPQTEITSALPDAASVTTVSNRTISFRAVDKLGAQLTTPPVHFECRMNGSAWDACSGSFNHTGLQDGAYQFEVRAVDDATQLVDGTPAKMEWTVDTTPPAITLVSAPPVLSNHRTFNVDFDVNEPTMLLSCSLDGRSPVDCSTLEFQTGALTERRHSLTINAIDYAGHETTLTHSWSTDYTAPLNLVSGSYDMTTHMLTVSYATNDPTATFSCLNYNGDAIACLPSQFPVPCGRIESQVVVTDPFFNRSAPVWVGASNFDQTMCSTSTTGTRGEMSGGGGGGFGTDFGPMPGCLTGTLAETTCNEKMCYTGYTNTCTGASTTVIGSP